MGGCFPSRFLVDHDVADGYTIFIAQERNTRMSDTNQTFDRHIYRVLLGITAVTIGIGTVVYRLVEHMSWLDAYYLSVVTLTTVGYGDLSPQTAFGKVFTTFYIFSGVGILTTYIAYNMRRLSNRFLPRAEHKDGAD